MPRRRKNKSAKKHGISILTTTGLMRFIFLSTAGLVDAERFAILPTHRINFKRGPDRLFC